MVALGLGDQAENRHHTTTLAKHSGWGLCCPLGYSFKLMFFYDGDGDSQQSGVCTETTDLLLRRKKKRFCCALWLFHLDFFFFHNCVQYFRFWLV